MTSSPGQKHPHDTGKPVEMSLVVSRHSMKTYKDVLLPTVYITSLFNSKAIAKSRFARVLEKALFVLLFFGLSFIAILAVFARSGIDTWIQFSLYIVPLFSMICGHLIFSSSAFEEILSNPVGDDANESKTFNNLSYFLRKRSLKMCFYPVSLVLYQWTFYLIFFYDNGSSEFSGPLNISEHSSYVTRSLDLDLNQETWLPLYYIFWTIAMYVSGFIGCCFILVVDIHKLDIKSFLLKVGNGPLVRKRKRPNHHGNVYPKTRVTNHGEYQAVGTRIETPVGLCFNALSLFIGFLTLGLVELGSIPPWEAEQMSGVAGHEENRSDAGTRNYAGDRNDAGHRYDAGEVSDSGITNGLSGSLALENGNVANSNDERGRPLETVTPRQASELLIELMSSLETNSSLFKPFLVLLTFFSVTNLVTHVVAMAVVNISGFTDLHWWTLVRTLFWFLLAIRLLWTVATITKALSRIIPHIYYLRSVGQLVGAKEEWDDFFQLAETFHFGSRTYGFPLTLNQVASIVALVNFSFLIALSLIPKTQD